MLTELTYACSSPTDCHSAARGPPPTGAVADNLRWPRSIIQLTPLSRTNRASEAQMSRALGFRRCHHLARAGLLIAVPSVLSAQPAPTWALGKRAILSSEDAAQKTEFHRIVGALRASNGFVAVLDAGSNSLVVLDSAGGLVARVGRKGSGPGEFQSPRWAGRIGDTAAVYDLSTRRLSLIAVSRAPKFIKEVRVSASSTRGGVSVIGRLPDGRMVARTLDAPGFSGPVGVNRMIASVGLIAEDGAGAVEWVAEGKGAAVFVHRPTPRIEDAQVGGSAFSPDFYVAITDSRLWIGDSSTDEVMSFDAISGRRSAVRLPLRRVSPTPSQIALRRAADSQVSRRNIGSFLNEKYSSERLPNYLPFFGPLVSGQSGEVWIEVYTPIRGAEMRYVILTSRGEIGGQLTVPGGFRLLDAGADYVLGVSESADGVENVQIFRFVRPAGSARVPGYYSSKSSGGAVMGAARRGSAR
jgi:hypothetical protein